MDVIPLFYYTKGLWHRRMVWMPSIDVGIPVEVLLCWVESKCFDVSCVRLDVFEVGLALGWDFLLCTHNFVGRDSLEQSNFGLSFMEVCNGLNSHGVAWK